MGADADPSARASVLDKFGTAAWIGTTLMLRHIPRTGLLLALLGLLSVAWMPTNKREPVPNPVLVEVTADFAALEQSQLTYDGDAIMANYTPGVTFRLEDPAAVLLRSADAARIREGFVLPSGFDRSQVEHLSGQKADFQFQPGVEAMPGQTVGCALQRNPQGLQIELKITRSLMSVRNGLPALPKNSHPPPSAIGFEGTRAGAARIVPRVTPLRPVAAGDKLIEDEASGFNFHVRSDATVEKSVTPAGTGMTRYRCALSRDGISIVFDLYPLPGGRGAISPRQVQDLLALKPANIRRATGHAEISQQTLVGQPVYARYYNEESETPGRPGRAYWWIGSRYALMVSITCLHPEDMNPVVEKTFRGIRFPEN